MILGLFYKWINSFIEAKGGLNAKLSLQLGLEELNELKEDNEIDDPGFYVKAFCSGLKEVLALYKEHILAIEHEYFVNESLNIAHINLKL